MRSSPEVEALLTSWMRALRSEGKSSATLRAYSGAVRTFTDWCIENGRPTDPGEQTRDDVREFTIHTLDTLKAGTAATRFRNLRQWFKWLMAESEIDADPSDGLRQPTVEESTVPVISDDDLRALIDTTSGSSFVDRRDRAMLRVLIDTGMRRGELVGLNVADVHLDVGLILVRHTKTKQDRPVPIGTKTVADIDRYLRRPRKLHKYADRPELWLGASGPISGDMVRKILEKRCKEAGIARVRPHQFRHTAAHRWLLNGGQEQDLARIAGWAPGSVMLARYGRSAATERAREAHRKLAPGDSL